MGGNVDDVKGNIKETVGSATADKDLENEGKADQVGAKIKDAFEDAKHKIEDAVDAAKDRSHPHD